MPIRWTLQPVIVPVRAYLPECVAITIALSAVPLVAGLVPPNLLYGFRTPTTLESTDVWYAANRLMGAYMLGSQLIAIATLGRIARLMEERLGRDRATWGVGWACVTALAGIGLAALHFNASG